MQLRGFKIGFFVRFCMWQTIVRESMFRLFKIMKPRSDVFNAILDFQFSLSEIGKIKLQRAVTWISDSDKYFLIGYDYLSICMNL